MEIIDTDVLVIGSGIAGLRAALEASRAGKRVLVVSKAPLGRANNTYLAGGLFTFASKSGFKEKHVEKTIKSGRMLNDRKLVMKFADKAPSLVLELSRMGLKGTLHDLGMVTRQSALIGGPNITPPLVAACRDAGVTHMEGIMVADLITDDDSCLGAVGFDKITGDTFGFRALSVIIATGGAGAIYAQNDNAPGLTGDGYALALKAGLELKDMEFVQFYPMVRAKGGHARMIIPAVLADLGKITNRLGEDLKEKYNLKEKPIAIASRDRFARALFLEISQGNGIEGGIHLNLQGVSDDKIPFNSEVIALLRRKLSYKKKPITIAPSCHHTMGGLTIDESGRTPLKGLFAAGEVVGGIHGANRMGGNALTESLVFGFLAARSACDHSDSVSHSKKFRSLAEKSIQDNVNHWLGQGTESSRLTNVMDKIKRVLWEKAGIIRSGLTLKEAVRLVDEIQDGLEVERAGNPRDLRRLLECRNALLTGRAIAVSAMERKESRGSHFRTDFPLESEDWLRHVYVKMTNGKPGVSRTFPAEG